jgi:putative nucleotidyltransferase with HDIG domain
MKKHILFVDDDCNILEGLRRMLHGLRNEWDMQFAVSGAEALEIMDAQPIDIIVSDLRMPEMDGAVLMREVTKRHPDSIRIILSGQADSDLIMKAIGATHQFLSKPCDPETLKSIIHRAISLRALLQNGDLKDTISKMDTIPSIPTLYLELTDELQLPEPSVHEIGQIIAKDPGMTAKILQLANSAFFGRRRSISNSTEAVAYLGLDRIRNLLLVSHIFSQFTPPETSSFSIDMLWEHSISTAALAKTIAEEEKAAKDIIEDAFTAGLLHDIGKLMLACKLADKHEEAVNLAKGEDIPLWAAEKQIFSTTHAEIGAYLLGLWGLPDAIVEATAYHHRPMESPNRNFCALTALYAADCLNGSRSNSAFPAPPPNVEYLSTLLRKSSLCLNAIANAVE